MSEVLGHCTISDMRERLAPYLAVLRQLPFVERAAVTAPERAGTERADACLRLRTPARMETIAVELKGTLNRLAIERILAHAAPDKQLLVLAPYVPPALGQMLAGGGVGFADLAGNCHLVLGRNYVAHVEGRRPPKAERRGRGLGATGYRILFALLARDKLLDAPVRTFAEAAGVGKTAVADVLRRLEADGTLGRTRRRRVLMRREALLERWLAGYGDLLRPRLLLGRYRGPDDDPLALESRVEETLKKERGWAFGGTAAAYRLIQHYRGATTVVHLDRPHPDLPRRLGVLPAEDGPLVLLGVPGPAALAGPRPRVAHPLLVYTELLVAGEQRARETAALLRERYGA